MNAAEQRRVADAATMDPDLVAKLPRIGVPKKTWIAVAPNRMAVGRACTDFFDKDGLTYYRDVYEDCPHCRRDREAFVNRRGAGLDREALIAKLRRDRDLDGYWCNNCQGTGWFIESWAAVTERLGLVTWEQVIAELTDETLVKLVNAGPALLTRGYTQEGYPVALLNAELTRRFEARAPA